MIGDLHVHTRHSDGSHSPRETLVRAAARGLDFVSFVDHDTTAGTAAGVEIAARLGIAFVPGIEISAFDFGRGRKVHLLGYGYRLPATAIEELCAPLREARHANTLRQIDEVRDAGYEITLEAVAAHARGERLHPPAGLSPGDHIVDEPTLYKQHIMLALIDAGATDRIYSPLYHDLFRGNGPAAHDIEYVDVFDALRAIHADGGLAVLAHPGQLDSWDLVPALVEAGLDGIELFHEDHGPAEKARVRELAAGYGLFTTGGSDWHGDYGSQLDLGDLVAPADAFRAVTRPRDAGIAWAVDLVLRAGALARTAVAGEMRAEMKESNIRDLVTEHDLAVERFLTHEIRARYPDHDFVTEEHDHPEAGPDAPVWIIDPIDGTTNFVASRRDFAICVAHYRDGRPRFGIVYDAMEDELYLGIAGEGATVNGVPLLPADREPKTPAQSVIECSLNASWHLSTIAGADPAPLAVDFRAQRAWGSAALGICRVARGTLDVYLAATLSLWDYAAAAIVLTEAGGAWSVGGRRGTADEGTLRAGWSASSDLTASLPPVLHDGKRVVLAACHPQTLAAVERLLFPDAP